MSKLTADKIRLMAPRERAELYKNAKRLDTDEAKQVVQWIKEIDAKATSTRTSTGHKPVQLTGRQLNEEWEVFAEHALFHWEGHWYNNLERFPGALFDPHGYVEFRSEEEYKTCRHLKIGKETNVPNGISSIPGYIRKA